MTALVDEQEVQRREQRTDDEDHERHGEQPRTFGALVCGHRSDATCTFTSALVCWTVAVTATVEQAESEDESADRRDGRPIGMFSLPQTIALVVLAAVVAVGLTLFFTADEDPELQRRRHRLPVRHDDASPGCADARLRLPPEPERRRRRAHRAGGDPGAEPGDRDHEQPHRRGRRGRRAHRERRGRDGVDGPPRRPRRHARHGERRGARGRCRRRRASTPTTCSAG